MMTVQTSPQSESPYLYHLKQYILPENLSSTGELNWGRLIGTWHEKNEGHVPLTHVYAICIDGKEGGLYMDCRPSKIFIKCIVHLFVRPLHALIKTIYHLSLYPIFYEIAKIYQNRQWKQENTANLFKASLDIILTPLYGVLLTLTTVGVLISGIFASENLYEGRKLLAKMEQASNWGRRWTPWTLAKCFQPDPLEVLKQFGVKKFDDTIYNENEAQEIMLLERALSNYIRARIRFKKKCFDIFSCSKLKNNEIYQSSIYGNHS